MAALPVLCAVSRVLSRFPAGEPLTRAPSCAPTVLRCGTGFEGDLCPHRLLSSYLGSLLTVPVSATAKDTAGGTDSLGSALGSLPFPQMCVCFPIPRPPGRTPGYLLSELVHTRSLLSGGPVHEDPSAEAPILEALAHVQSLYKPVF